MKPSIARITKSMSRPNPSGTRCPSTVEDALDHELLAVRQTAIKLLALLDERQHRALALPTGTSAPVSIPARTGGG
jgi:hypothetical protein